MTMLDDSTPLTTGTVEWFDDERGVGLISSDDGAPPCAVHAGTLLIPETIDAIRALTELEADGAEPIAKTNAALGISGRLGGFPSLQPPGAA